MASASSDLLKPYRRVFVVAGDRDEGESLLRRPRVHDAFDVGVGGQEDAVDASLVRQEVPHVVFFRPAVPAGITRTAFSGRIVF